MEIPQEVHEQLMKEREVVMSSDSGDMALGTAWRAIDFLLDAVLELNRLVQVEV